MGYKLSLPATPDRAQQDDRRVPIPRGYWAFQAAQANAQLLERLAREQTANVAEERNRLARSTPVDRLGATGVPLIGPGAAGGTMPGTDPQWAVVAREERRR